MQYGISFLNNIMYVSIILFYVPYTGYTVTQRIIVLQYVKSAVRKLRYTAVRRKINFINPLETTPHAQPYLHALFHPTKPKHRYNNNNNNGKCVNLI